MVVTFGSACVFFLGVTSFRHAFFNCFRSNIRILHTHVFGQTIATKLGTMTMLVARVTYRSARTTVSESKYYVN